MRTLASLPTLLIVVVTFFSCTSQNSHQICALLVKEENQPLPRFPSDRTVLRLFYQSWTSGDSWTTSTNWLSKTHSICKWYGVTCADPNSERIEKLELSSNNLDGYVPLSILAQLPELTTLRLDGNQLEFNNVIEQSLELYEDDFSYNILENYFQSSLIVLDLSHNRVGNLQKVLGSVQYPNLTHMYLSHAHLSTNIPSNLPSIIPNIQKLELGFNELRGVIPDQLAAMYDLRYLSIRDNKLSGTLPRTLTRLKFLTTLILQNNNLNGKLGREWHLDSSRDILPVIETLDISRQKITGPIPSFSKGSMLKKLDISSNAFTGPLPTDFLNSINKASFIKADLHSNKIRKISAQSLSHIPIDRLLLHDNEITEVDDAFCYDKTQNEIIDCGSLLCPPLSYGPDEGNFPCLPCETNTLYWGLTACNIKNDDQNLERKPSISVNELEVLKQIFKETGGSNWRNKFGWESSAENHCSWYGISCIENFIVSINLRSNGLVGIPPTNLFELKKLESLDLSSNVILFSFENIERAVSLSTLNIAATRTSQLTGISNAASTLETLYLESNAFTSYYIPAELYQLTNLRKLSLDHNGFVGKIIDIGSLSLLVSFTASNNDLTGKIPENISILTGLRVLKLQHNHLIGQISDIASLPNLVDLDLSYQQSESNPAFIGLTGWLSPFASDKLRQLKLQDNSLSGPIPANFLGHVSPNVFEYADLSHNFLKGEIPLTLANYSEIVIKENQITSIEKLCSAKPKNDFGCDFILCRPGTFSIIGRMQSFDTRCEDCDLPGTALYFGSTTCSGDIQSNSYSLSVKAILEIFYTNCGGWNWHRNLNWENRDVHFCEFLGVFCNEDKHITQLVLRSNNLVGSIPHEIYAIESLEILDLSGNDIMIDFDGIENLPLISLDVSHTYINSLKGIGKAEKLEELDLNGNHLHGTFPSDILKLEKLQHLSLDDNEFSGKLPSLAILSKLTFLSLQNNNFYGTIPLLSTSVEVLFLGFNGFSGTIPKQLTAMTDLIYLDFSKQKVKSIDGLGLRGSIPSFRYHASLKKLDLSQNSLSSIIPSNFIEGIDSRTFMFLDLSQNRLTGIVPSSLSNLDPSSYDLSDNLLSGISDELCEEIIGIYSTIEKDCSAVLCPPQTFSNTGRDVNRNGQCTECIMLPEGIFGATSCGETSDTQPSESLLGSMSSFQSSAKSEKAILMLLYSACGGKDWLQQDAWLTSSNVCNWFGIECNEDENVKALILDNNNVIGTLPSEVFDLPYLDTLVLESNEMVVNFDNIMQAQSLKYLDLKNTALFDLNGLDKALNLKQVILSSNKIIGKLPDKLFALTNLEQLYLDSNKITGILPENIGAFSKLEVLSLHSNLMTGSLPDSLFDLNDLSHLWLQGNAFVGKISTKIELMTNLMYLDISHQTNNSSGLTGHLPSFELFSDIRYLNLSYNSINGKILENFLANIVANPVTFEFLDLQSNMLSGTIPKSLSRLSKKTILFQDNHISSVQSFCVAAMGPTFSKTSSGCSGLCPPQFFNSPSNEECKSCPDATYWGSTSCKTNLENYYLNMTKENINKELLFERKVLSTLFEKCNGDFWFNSNNWLDEDEHICNWRGIYCDGDEKIQSISLGSNNLKGTLPAEIFLLPNLKYLSLYLNQLQGFDFSVIKEASSLKELILDHTGIRSITGIEKAPNLEVLKLRFNRISGEFPIEILEMKSLKSLSISHNKLTTLPVNLNKLEHLSSFIVSSNRIKGGLNFQFPSSIKIIDLSNNNIGGSIPNTFLNGVKTESELDVDLSDNTITGQIPSSLSRFEKMNLFLKNNYITSIGEGLCEQTKWNNREVGKLGCDAIICKPGRYNVDGRTHSGGSICKSCKSARYYGTTFCEENDATKTSESHLIIPILLMLISLSLLFSNW